MNANYTTCPQSSQNIFRPVFESPRRRAGENSARSGGLAEKAGATGRGNSNLVGPGGMWHNADSTCLRKKRIMSDERLIVRMDGPARDGGAILVRHFHSVMNGALGLLKQAGAELAAEKNLPKFDCFVAAARQGGPHELEIACRSVDRDAPPPPADGGVVRAVSDILRSFADQTADRLSAPMMSKVEELAAPCRAGAAHRLTRLELGFVNGREIAPRFQVDAPFAERVARARGREFACRTTVAGRAKMLDLRRDDKIRMKVVTIWGETACLIDPRLKERALAAMDKPAIMRGMGRYRPRDCQPHQIEVSDPDGIEVARADPRPIDLSSLGGAFPGLTGGKSTMEYLREIRGEE